MLPHTARLAFYLALITVFTSSCSKHEPVAPVMPSVIAPIASKPHYWNQNLELSMGIDSVYMLQYLQAKDQRFAQTHYRSTVPDSTYQHDPFRRMLNKQNPVANLQLQRMFDTPQTFAQYNNNYYQLNDEYKAAITAPWDDVLLKALYCDVLGYDDVDYQLLLSLRDDKGDYTDTHVFLGLIWLRDIGCPVPPTAQADIDRQSDSLVAALNTQPPFDDLYAERVAMLYWAGKGDRVRPEWVEVIKAAQDPVTHGWSHEYPDPHTSGLAELALLFFAAGTAYQPFFLPPQPVSAANP